MKSSSHAPDAGEAFRRLVELMATLRSSRGCPWCREQTLESLRPFLLEETLEVIASIDRRDISGLRDELGDFFFEAVFVAQLCSERGDFDVTASLRAICDKLIRRNPHVFGDRPTGVKLTSAEAQEQWQAIKATERDGNPQRAGLLDGVSDALPSLIEAFSLAQRAAALGFDHATVDAASPRLHDELTRLQQLCSRDPHGDAVPELVGGLLFAVASLAQRLTVDPESALRAANRRFRARFAALRRSLCRRGVAVQDTTHDELTAAWRRAVTEQS